MREHWELWEELQVTLFGCSGTGMVWDRKGNAGDKQDMKNLQGRACRLYPRTTADPCKLTSAGEWHEQIWVLEKLLIACEEWTMFSTEIKIPLETWIEFPGPGFG